ncbi:MAG: TonB-dependent receptor, partial [Opitutaceae bacterium]|nr:TonB-dependent receptor [Opitutaceae bacterium]
VTLEEHDSGVYSADWVWYQNELTHPENLPAGNFNNPLVVTLTDTAHFFQDRLRLLNNFDFRKGDNGLVSTLSAAGETAPDGKRYYKYTERKYSDTFYWDISVEADIRVHREKTVTLFVKVLNILNRHSLVNTSTSASDDGLYTAGRQLFAGIQYKF